MLARSTKLLYRESEQELQDSSAHCGWRNGKSKSSKAVSHDSVIRWKEIHQVKRQTLGR